MVKKVIGIIMFVGVIGIIIAFLYSEAYQEIFPKNSIEKGATSTGHVINIANSVSLSRTSAKRDSLIIEREDEQIVVSGFFDRLDFNDEYALLFEEESELYYYINLKTLDVDKFPEDQLLGILEQSQQEFNLKKHYNFDWTL